MNSSLSSLISSGEAYTEMAVKAACLSFEFLLKFLKAASLFPYSLIGAILSSFNVFLNHL
jgi:hypothetical protein